MLTTTNTHLLDGLEDPENQTVWREYVDRYRPLIVTFAAKLGFAADDAQDIAQETLLEFSRAYRERRYDRDHGRLRSWLFGIAHNKVREAARRRSRREVQVDDPTGANDVAESLAAPAELERLWEEEWHQAVIRQCLEEARRDFSPTTIEAFRLFAIDELSAEQVAERLDLTSTAVFSAKHRVLRRIRELVPRIAEIW